MQYGRAALGLARPKGVELLECKTKEAMLRAASEDGDTAIVKKLLGEGADVNSRDTVSAIVSNPLTLSSCTTCISMYICMSVIL